MIEKVTSTHTESSGDQEVIPPVDPDDSFFVLSHPIQVGDKTFDKLNINPKDLPGDKYFQFVARFRKEYPDIYAMSPNKLNEEVFLTYIIAALNPPMTPEDMRKISFIDLPMIFMKCPSFIYRARMDLMTQAEKAEIAPL